MSWTAAAASIAPWVNSYFPAPWGGRFPSGTGFPGGPPIPHPDPRPGPPGPGLPRPPEKNINWGEVLKAGNSADYFGHADYSEALSRGASRQQILRYLDANPGKLRAQNVKGGGGLYDQIQKDR